MFVVHDMYNFALSFSQLFNTKLLQFHIQKQSINNKKCGTKYITYVVCEILHFGNPNSLEKRCMLFLLVERDFCFEETTKIKVISVIKPPLKI